MNFCSHGNFPRNCYSCSQNAAIHILTSSRPLEVLEDTMAHLEAETRHFPKAQKHDQEKTDLSLLSSIAIMKIGEVMTFGKRKYAAHNWRAGFAWSRLLAAALRHIISYMGGEDTDPESGLSHLAHAACCIMFLLEFEVTHKDKDDRWKQK